MRVYYDANGGSSIMFHEELTLKGGKATLKSCGFDAPAYNYIFSGWNTEPDGSGTSYAAGDVIDLDGDVTLYAQWQQISGFRAVMRLLAQLVLMIMKIFIVGLFNTFC